MKFKKIAFIIFTLIVFSNINIALGQYHHLKLNKDINSQLKKKEPCINASIKKTRLTIKESSEQLPGHDLVQKMVAIKKEEKSDSNEKKNNQETKADKAVKAQKEVKKQIKQPFKRKLLKRKRIAKLRKNYQKANRYKIKRFKPIRYYGLPVPKHEINCKSKPKNHQAWIFKKDTYTQADIDNNECNKNPDNGKIKYKTFCKLVNGNSQIAWIFKPDTQTKVKCSKTVNHLS